jgi:NADH-quinone oxidoreductase subunit L
VTWFLRNAWIIPALPTVAFVIILLFGKRLPQKGSEVGIAAVGASFVLAILTAIAWIRQPLAGSGEERVRAFLQKDLFAWFDWQRRAVDASGHATLQHNVTSFGIHIDGLAVMMLFVVTFISLMVHVYSTGYMEGDRRYTYFYAALALFTASMLLMVSSSNTMELLLGWEGTSVCSFMLIGHWWEDKPNSDAAVKAFLTTRVGDIGLLIGLAMTFFIAGQSFDIEKINQTALDGHVSHTLLLVAAVALFGAVVGKSAQFPLHTWLPDAMAGPTPVSALIHAATMVVAGVYLLARFYGVFSQAFSIFTPGHNGLNLVAVIGGTTIVIAAFLAFVQHDIKKVLAYSTISQLGYMVMALGVGAWTAALFHLFTHAFFKADLFLGAGSVSHGGSHHSFDMKKDMGGLRHYMPTTYVTFVIGSAALAGIFPLAGFWSKDEILVTAGHNGYRAFMIVGLIGAAMTAGYMARCVWLTFHGEYRGHGHPHESPKSITVPLVILTVMSVIAGWLNGFGLHAFTKWTANDSVLRAMALGHVTEAKFSIPTAAISVALALATAGAVWSFYQYHAFEALHGRTEKSKAALAGYNFLANKYYLDVLYTDRIVYGVKGPIAQAAYWLNQNVIDGIVNGVALGARYLAQFLYDVVDQGIVDGAVNGAGFTAEGGGGFLRAFQTGRVQQYAAAFFGLGVVAIGVGLLVVTHAFG